MSSEMMNTIQVVTALAQAAASCIGLPGLVISLLLLWRQLREQTVATKAAIYQNFTATMIDIDRFFIDHPELKPFFYNGKDLAENDPEYPRVQSTAEMFLDFADFVLMHKKEMPTYPWSQWEDYFLEIYRNSPVLRRYWAQNEGWYTGTLDWLFHSPKAKTGGND